jgi:hypothetical protein
MPLFHLFVLLAQLSELAGSIPFAVSVSANFCAANFHQTTTSSIDEQMSISAG